MKVFNKKALKGSWRRIIASLTLQFYFAVNSVIVTITKVIYVAVIENYYYNSGKVYIYFKKSK